MIIRLTSYILAYIKAACTGPRGRMDPARTQELHEIHPEVRVKVFFLDRTCFAHYFGNQKSILLTRNHLFGALGSEQG